MLRSLLISLLCLVAMAQTSPPTPATPRVIHVFVALADNQYQGIVPVPAKLGNGDDPARNLYWGAAYGVRTFFSRSREWKALGCSAGPRAIILERCIYRHRDANVYLIADAHRGREIKQTTSEFLSAAAGIGAEQIITPGPQPVKVGAGGASDLVAYIGHDGLMDFQMSPVMRREENTKNRDVIILACASKQYFAHVLRPTGANPLLWTTNLMAPEAYTLESAIAGWIANETGGQIRERAALAYDKYQRSGLKGARRLFATGW